MEDGISSRAGIHLFFSTSRRPRAAARGAATPQKLHNWPQNFPFLEENASNSPQILPSPAPAPVGAVPAGLAASRGCGRPKNSKSKVKNSQFSWWERLQWQLCVARLGARGWRRLWGVKDTSRRPLRRGQGISWSSWERERIPSSGTGAPSDPQHEGGQGSWPGRGQDASG